MVSQLEVLYLLPDQVGDLTAQDRLGSQHVGLEIMVNMLHWGLGRLGIGDSSVFFAVMKTSESTR